MVSQFVTQKSKSIQPAPLARETLTSSNALCGDAPSPHSVEVEIHRRLLNHPDLKIAQLRVHRCPQGICLEGFVLPDSSNVDIGEIVQGIEGVTKIINRIVSHQCSAENIHVDVSCIK